MSLADRSLNCECAHGKRVVFAFPPESAPKLIPPICTADDNQDLIGHI